MSSTQAAKEAIKMAIQMERDGYDFYKKAATQTSSETGQAIFEGLARDEILHLEIFQRIYEEKAGKVERDSLLDSSKKYTKLPVFPKDLRAVERLDPDTNELDAIRMAINSEQQAIEHYTRILEGTEDKDVAEIILEIIKQEKNHSLILQEELTHLNCTGCWYELDVLGG